MSYLVTVTFDLHEVPEEAWEEVYKAAYTALAKIGLTHIATSEHHRHFKPLLSDLLQDAGLGPFLDSALRVTICKLDLGRSRFKNPAFGDASFYSGLR